MHLKGNVGGVGMLGPVVAACSRGGDLSQAELARRGRPPPRAAATPLEVQKWRRFLRVEDVWAKGAIAITAHLENASIWLAAQIALRLAAELDPRERRILSPSHDTRSLKDGGAGKGGRS